MPQHSQEVVKQFEQQCMWAHQSWQTRKCLFDDKSNLPTFQQPHYEHFFLRLSIILQEYWMLQVAKLHDPVGKPGQHNLSVDYMIECGDWNAGAKIGNEVLDGKLPDDLTVTEDLEPMRQHAVELTGPKGEPFRQWIAWSKVSTAEMEILLQEWQAFERDASG
jgi:hypothetical protein